MDALFENGSKESAEFVGRCFETTEDVKVCKNDIADGDLSYWMVVTRSQESCEEMIEVMTGNDGICHDHFHVGGKDEQLYGWEELVAVWYEEMWSFDCGCM